MKELTKKLKQATLEEKAALKTKRETRDKWRCALYHLKSSSGYNDFLLEALSEGINIKYFDYDIKNQDDKYSSEEAKRLLLTYLESLGAYDEALIVFDEALKDAWQNDVSLEAISKAIGKKYNMTYYWVAKQPWFEKRRKDNKVK